MNEMPKFFKDYLYGNTGLTKEQREELEDWIYLANDSESIPRQMYLILCEESEI